MWNSRTSVGCRHGNLKDTKVVLLHLMRVAVPAVEVANEVSSQSTGGPFSVDDVSVWLHVEAKLFVALMMV